MPLTERDVTISVAKTPTSPSQKPPSKLPRRVRTQNIAPSTTGWTSRVANRVASTDTLARQASNMSDKKRESVTASSYQRPHKRSSVDRPISVEKPLPSRPVARISNMLSPSKDSRGLIDASERPLHITTTSGDKQEWPALQPQASYSTKLESSESIVKPDEDIKPSSGSESPATASMMAAASELTNVITGNTSGNGANDRRASRSSVSSYASATDFGSVVEDTEGPNLHVEKMRSHTDSVKRTSRIPSVRTPTKGLPVRQVSLRDRISNGSIIPSPVGSGRQLMAFTDFTRANTASPDSADSRPHSPSPASFSQPRPGSASFPSLNSKTTKTASRIPIPDTKKATVVDVRTNKRSSSGPTTMRPVGGPSFGTRKLNTPEALKILEEGKMRRHLRRTNTNGATAAAQLDRNSISESSAPTIATPSLSRSQSNSSECSLAPKSPDAETMSPTEYEIASLSDTQTRFSKHTRTVSRKSMSFSTCQRDDSPSDLFEHDTFVVARLPPQTSPYTGPLETIPSEAALPLPGPRLVDETQSQLTRTLSHLEGKGSPPKTDVDNHTLHEMFSHLRHRFDHNSHQSTTFVENAAAAEKFLAMRGSSVAEAKDFDCDQEPSGVSQMQNSDHVAPESNPEVGARKQTTVSKWSDSTPSDKALSPPSDGLLSKPLVASPKPARPAPRPPKDAPGTPVSIGYPSRIPGRVAPAITQASADAAPVTNVARRVSSPTLGKPDGGSIRVARGGIRVTPHGFARNTVSSAAKMPASNTKADSLSASSQRGRTPSSQKSHAKPNGVIAPKVRALNGFERQRAEGLRKTPRSRSKSRYVLDKINGLFSGKREKRTQAVPPLPSIQEHQDNHENQNIDPKGVQVSADGSPTLRSATKTPQPPKMPSLSPGSHLAVRSPSQNTMQTEDTTVVDGLSLTDDSRSVQGLSEYLVGKACQEHNPIRRERLLNFAKVLNDSLISAREAQISAETAQEAARNAQISYEMTRKSLAMLHRLAASVIHSSSNRR